VDSTHTGREGERNPKEGARYLRITGRWKEGKTPKRRKSSREDVSVINEIGETNGGLEYRVGGQKWRTSGREGLTQWAPTTAVEKL
jgi:hypothetical protein